jgi:hypothetical protein
MGYAPPPIRRESKGNTDKVPVGKSAYDSLFLIWANAVKTGKNILLAGA